jgi:hypothetical protein
MKLEPTIEGTIKYISSIFQRKLTPEEVLAIGIAFQNGILRGLKEAEKNRDKKDQN